MNRFEQLIEYVINDEDAKARELFHEIVVEKSREIYENIMQEEEDEDKEDKELDEAEDDDEEMVDEGDMGGRAAPDLIDDVEMEEESDVNMEAEDDEEIDVDVTGDMGDDDMGDDDMGGDGDLEDRVMDLEDKLDELMAEFEELMGDEGSDMGDGDDFDMDAGGDAIEMDDTEEMMPEMGAPMPMEEAINLKAAPKPVTSEEGGINTKSVVTANSGAKGMASSPVKMTGDTAQGRPAPTTKDLIGKVGNTPAQGTQKPSPATKPHLSQATGVNNKSPLPSGTKG